MYGQILGNPRRKKKKRQKKRRCFYPRNNAITRRQEKVIQQVQAWCTMLQSALKLYGFCTRNRPLWFHKNE